MEWRGLLCCELLLSALNWLASSPATPTSGTAVRGRCCLPPSKQPGALSLQASRAAPPVLPRPPPLPRQAAWHVVLAPHSSHSGPSLLHRPASQLWFSRVLRDGFAAQLAGTFLPFKHFAAYHLGCLLDAHPAGARCAPGVLPSRPAISVQRG